MLVRDLSSHFVSLITFENPTCKHLRSIWKDLGNQSIRGLPPQREPSGGKAKKGGEGIAKTRLPQLLRPKHVFGSTRVQNMSEYGIFNHVLSL